MSETNDAMMRINKWFREHQQLEQNRDAVDLQIAQHEVDIATLQDQDDRFAARQAEIAAELAPALTKLGCPVIWREGRVDYVVSVTADGGISVEETKSWGHLASTMRPKLFTNDAITEAAFRAAAGEVFGVSDDDNDGVEWPAWTEKLRFTPTLPINGRQAIIANGVAVGDQAAS